MEELIRPLEYAIASFAADYAEAGNRLNPFLDAEVHSLGSAMLVYSGQVSRMHGGFALALEGELSREDYAEIDEFFFRMGRDPEYFASPLTAKETLDTWKKQGFEKSDQENVFWHDLQSLPAEKNSSITSMPDHGDWVNLFGQTLFASTVMHMRNTRFFCSETEAGFLYFHQKHALSFFSKIPSNEMLTAMLQFAKEFQSKGVALILPEHSKCPSQCKKIYERSRLTKQRKNS